MRINIIPTNRLTDQHLVAEYREIKMLPKMLRRSINSKNGVNLNKIPKQYTLNAGHGLFFYNKLSFIRKRFNDLLGEMSNRGFKTNCTVLEDNGFPSWAYNDYEPTIDAMKINIERILLRISDKPLWYSFNKKKYDLNEYEKMYGNFI